MVGDRERHESRPPSDPPVLDSVQCSFFPQPQGETREGERERAEY